MRRKIYQEERLQDVCIYVCVIDSRRIHTYTHAERRKVRRNMQRGKKKMKLKTENGFAR